MSYRVRYIDYSDKEIEMAAATKQMQIFLVKEGHRVTGVDLDDPDGVFIYTDASQWCDDHGAGSFRGDSQSEAIRRFYDRVQQAPV